MRYTITAPNPTFTGKVATINFVDGKAEASDDTSEGRRAVAYCRQAGYSVAPTEEADVAEEPKQESEPVAPPAKSASKADWVEFVVKHRDVDQAEAEKLTHAQLVAEYGPKEEQQ